MAKDSRNDDSDFDALLESTMIKINEEINENAPSNKSRWESLKKNFIEEGIWQESIFSKIFYWPVKTLDRIILALKSLFMLFLGIGIALMQPALLIMKGESEINNQVQTTSENIHFDYEIVKNEANPINFRQTIVSAAIDAKITITVRPSITGETELILHNLSPMSNQIILKALLGLGNQAKGNVKLIIRGAKNK